MEKNQQNECQCSKSVCGCVKDASKRCSCGEACRCVRTCGCAQGCACVARE